MLHKDEKNHFIQKVQNGILKSIPMYGCTLYIPATFIEVNLGTSAEKCKYAGVLVNQRPLKYPDAPEFYFFYPSEMDIWCEGFEEAVWRKCCDISPEFNMLHNMTISALKDGEEYGSNLDLPAFGIHPIDDFDYYMSQKKYDSSYRMPYDAIRIP